MIHSRKSLSNNIPEKLDTENQDFNVEVSVKTEDKQENKEDQINIEKKEEKKEEKKSANEDDLMVEAKKYEDNEVQPLLKNKKNQLQDKFGELSNKFKKFDNMAIYDIIDKYSEENKENSSKQNENESTKEIKKAKRKHFEKRNCCISSFAFLFLLLYLIGIFQLLDLFDSTKKQTGIIFKSFFFNQPKEGNETFKDFYINSCFKTIPEFDFAFVTSFLGSFPLNICGFFFSSLAFAILNTFLFLNFIELDFEKQKFDFFDFFHASIYFLLFFISFGVISLFPHEKVSEGIFYYENHKRMYAEEKEDKNEETKKENKENKETNENNENNEEQIVKKFQEVKEVNEIDQEPKLKDLKHKLEMQYKNFMIISLGIIFAYILNKLGNFLLYHFRSEFFDKKFKKVFIAIYVGTYCLSLFCYLIFHYQIMVLKEIENYEEDEEDRIKSGFYRVCGFIMFYEKIPIDNRTEDDKNSYKQKKDKELKQQNDKLLGGKDFVNGCKIFWSIIIPCYKSCNKENKYSKFYCASCKLGCRKFFYKSIENNLNLIKCCTCCKCKDWCCPSCECQKCCCECCAQLKELKEDYEEEEIFCYVYQTQRKCSWFCDLFFNNNILLLIIHNISIELGIIGFEKKLNENLESRRVEDNIKNIGTYLGCFFLFTIIYTTCYFKVIKDKSYNYYPIFVIVFYVYNTTISGLYIFAKKNIKNLIDDWLIIPSLAYTKYINFIVIRKLVGILDEESLDILSNSLIMTSVFFIYDIIVFIITDFIECNSDYLIFFQFIIGFIFVFLMFWCIEYKCIDKKN